jgi:signal transduction histidine kinase
VRSFSLGVLMVVAVALVLYFSARSFQRERERLLQDFADTQQAAVHDLASGLEDRLLDTDEDGRVIATLVHADHRQQDLLASFNAMATVVRHYRSLALFGQDGQLKVSAVDPSEKSATAAALIEASRAAAASGTKEPRLTGPREVVPGRYVYLYSFEVGGEAVVITIDAPRFLQSLVRAMPHSRVVITDSGGKEWSGCAPNLPCSPQAPDERRHVAADTDEIGTRWLDDRTATAFDMGGSKAVAAWSTVGAAPLGRWRVLVVASASALHEREQALMHQLIATVVGLLGAIGLIGFMIVRQQRYSAALAERLRNAETLRSLEGQLIRAEKLATTGVLAAGIAHEVGTPLGIIRARAELLLDELGSAPGRRALDAIIQQIDRISSIIRQVLDFSRSQPVELMRVSPEPALQSALDLLEHRFRQQRLAVRAVVNPHVPDIAADPNQLQQVLINLILNACDASPTDGKIQIGVTPSDDSAFVVWEVRDEGSGIAHENLLAVFDPFFTTKKRGEGTGLGLPVATSIIRNHGGEITLASNPGQGTTVTFRWPMARKDLHVQG